MAIHTKTKTAAVLGLCLTLVGLGLGGCGSGQNGSGDGAGAIQVPEKKIRYAALAGQVRGLDPAGIGDVTSSSVGGNIYETLYQYHYLKRDPYVVIPSLAAEMPEVSDDGKTVTIKLKHGVKFQDDKCFSNGEGREMTAQDVIYSWKRLADVTQKLQTDNWWVFDGYIVGLDDFRHDTTTLKAGQKPDYDRSIEGLQAPDKYTVQLKLTKRWPQLKYVLAHLPTAVVPREAVETYGDNFINHPVGTGPFMLSQWKRRERLVLRKNPNYRKATYPSEGQPGDKKAGRLDDAGKRLPLIDGEVIKIMKEPQPRWLQFMKGRLDMSGIPKDNFGQAITQGRKLTQRMKDKGITLKKFDDPSTFWFGFNMKDPILGNNLPLRQAMNAAFDRERYRKLFSNGRGEIAHGFIPPVLPAYNPDLNSPYTHYDLRKARKLAAKAKKLHRKRTGKALPPVTLTFGQTNTTARQRGQFIAKAMHRAGVPFKVNYVTWPTLQEKMRNASFQVYASGWVADWPDAGNFIRTFYGPNKSPGPNSTSYDNPEFNKLYKKALTTADEDKRHRMYQHLEQIVVDDLPVIFDLHGQAYSLRYSWVENYKPMLYGTGTLKYMNLDVAQRAKRVDR